MKQQTRQTRLSSANEIAAKLGLSEVMIVERPENDHITHLSQDHTRHLLDVIEVEVDARVKATKRNAVNEVVMNLENTTYGPDGVTIRALRDHLSEWIDAMVEKAVDVKRLHRQLSAIQQPVNQVEKEAVALYGEKALAHLPASDHLTQSHTSCVGRGQSEMDGLSQVNELMDSSFLGHLCGGDDGDVIDDEILTLRPPPVYSEFANPYLDRTPKLTRGRRQHIQRAARSIMCEGEYDDDDMMGAWGETIVGDAHLGALEEGVDEVRKLLEMSEVNARNEGSEVSDVTESRGRWSRRSRRRQSIDAVSKDNVNEVSELRETSEKSGKSEKSGMSELSGKSE
eukprot:GHVN01070569.1.p1 GENE.GHVN01070569.1~~GHVN01070569.1.p1  ORF type:complete len:373 (+),score=146.83 GHVN01070569.1:97-1119(+)